MVIENKWEGINYYDETVPYEAGLPNSVPNAVGIHVSGDSENTNIKKKHIKNLKAAGCKVPVWLD